SARHPPMATLLTEPRTTRDPLPVELPPARPPTTEKPARLASLDAYRGFIMLAMASGGFALARVARNFPGDPVWQFLGFHTDLVAWVVCSFWDLIQPSFMFMVGVAIPSSYASRKARGDSDTRILAHTFLRALLLVLLGVFLTSAFEKRTAWVFTIVLCQIGLG